MLLGLLGNDDPYEVQAQTPGELRKLIVEAGDELRQIPAPREWSVLGCIAHITDAEVMMSSRYRLILAHDEPTLGGYDQDLWVDRLHFQNESPEDLLSSSSHFVRRTSRCGNEATRLEGHASECMSSAGLRATTWSFG